MKLPIDFSFSQANLQDFEDCEFRFYLRYIRRLEWPAVESEPVLIHEAQMQAGYHFHRLVERYFSGIDTQELEETITNPDLEFWWQSFMALGLKDLPGVKYAEKLLSIPFQGYRLLAKYDLLLIENANQAVIYDWKTTRLKPDRVNLLQKIQSRVYPAVLSLGHKGLSGFMLASAEDIEMVYWFPQFPFDSVHVTYSAERQESDLAYLSELTSSILTKSEGQFQKTDQLKRCEVCQYRSFCERGGSAGVQEDIETELSDNELDALSFDVL